MLKTLRDLNVRQVSGERAKPIIQVRRPPSDGDNTSSNFSFAPMNFSTIDIPKNKLASKFNRGWKVLMAKMKKRESYFAELYRDEDPYWNPAPRESATLATVNYNSYLIGGLNFDTVKELASVKITGDHIQW